MEGEGNTSLEELLQDKNVSVHMTYQSSSKSKQKRSKPPKLEQDGYRADTEMNQRYQLDEEIFDNLHYVHNLDSFN